MIHQPTDENITAAADLIRRGEVVAFPTETVYGLGADALNASAVEKIFEIKRRPRFDPLIVHLAEPGQIKSVVAMDPRIRQLLAPLERFWPGPLSVVMPKLVSVPDIVTAGLKTVAVRIPSVRASVRPNVALQAPLPSAVTTASDSNVSLTVS